jgi:hypothetical protein
MNVSLFLKKLLFLLVICFNISIILYTSAKYIPDLGRYTKSAVQYFGNKGFINPKTIGTVAAAAYLAQPVISDSLKKAINIEISKIDYYQQLREKMLYDNNRNVSVKNNSIKISGNESDADIVVIKTEGTKLGDLIEGLSSFDFEELSEKKQSSRKSKISPELKQSLHILGLQQKSIESENAEQNIKKAYKTQALKAHPDKGGSKEKFYKLEEAYKYALSHYQEVLQEEEEFNQEDDISDIAYILENADIKYDSLAKMFVEKPIIVLPAVTEEGCKDFLSFIIKKFKLLGEDKIKSKKIVNNNQSNSLVLSSNKNLKINNSEGSFDIVSEYLKTHIGDFLIDQQTLKLKEFIIESPFYDSTKFKSFIDEINNAHVEMNDKSESSDILVLYEDNDLAGLSSDNPAENLRMLQKENSLLIKTVANKIKDKKSEYFLILKELNNAIRKKINNSIDVTERQKKLVEIKKKIDLLPESNIQYALSKITHNAAVSLAYKLKQLRSPFTYLMYYLVGVMLIFEGLTDMIVQQKLVDSSAVTNPIVEKFWRLYRVELKRLIYFVSYLIKHQQDSMKTIQDILAMKREYKHLETSWYGAYKGVTGNTAKKLGKAFVVAKGAQLGAERINKFLKN